MIQKYVIPTNICQKTSHKLQDTVHAKAKEHTKSKDACTALRSNQGSSHSILKALHAAKAYAEKATQGNQNHKVCGKEGQ